MPVIIFVFLALNLFSAPAFAQFLQRAPLSAPEVMNIFTNRGFTQRVDRENSVFFYDSKPIAFNSSLGGSGGEILLQPFITVAGPTGETQFHMWVTYHPPLTPTGDTLFIRPKYLSIFTARQKLTLPLMYYYSASAPAAGTPVFSVAPGTPSPVGETAYAVFSAEDISALIAIALEGLNDMAVEAWEPNYAERFKIMAGGWKTDPNKKVQKQSIRDYLDFQKSIGNTNAQYRSLYWGEFDPLLPAMADQRAVSIVLYGEKETQGIDTVQERLVPVLEMVDLYQALSNRTIAMP